MGQLPLSHVFTSRLSARDCPDRTAGSVGCFFRGFEREEERRAESVRAPSVGPEAPHRSRRRGGTQARSLARTHVR